MIRKYSEVCLLDDKLALGSDGEYDSGSSMYSQRYVGFKYGASTRTCKAGRGTDLMYLL